MRDLIYERILKFREGAFTYHGWKRLIEDEDVNGKCGVRFIENIKIKAKYLYHALAILLNKKEADSLLTWESICGLAVEKVKKFEGADYNNDGTYHWVGARTVMHWFCHFRDNKESFVNIPHRQSLVDKHPLIFTLNLELKTKFICFDKANIQGLTGEVLLDYFHDTIIPELIEEEKSETGVEVTKKNYYESMDLPSYVLVPYTNGCKILGLDAHCPRKLTTLTGMSIQKLLPIANSMYANISKMNFAVFAGYSFLFQK